MAEIYLARATGIEGFERYVVVKRILGEHAKDTRFVKMFVDEARLAAQLHHQNIAQVYDCGQEDGTYYFAMEYVHGENLRELLKKLALARRQLPLEHALTIIAGGCAGLDYAHDKRGADRQPLGIVHRDVSPSNLIVAYDGGVKVVDFGIAKAASRMSETRSGTLKGKIAYMSPEQCLGRALDRRSDIFALGIVMYELTTVSRLFKGENDYITMNRIVTGDIPPPSKKRADYPAGLEAIVMKALALDPMDRYQTAGAMLEAIEQFAAKERISLSTTALGRFVREMFGEKPEPWLDGGEPARDPSSDEVDIVEVTQSNVGGGTAVTAAPPAAVRGGTSSSTYQPPPRGKAWIGAVIAAALVASAAIFVAVRGGSSSGTSGAGAASDGSAGAIAPPEGAPPAGSAGSATPAGGEPGSAAVGSAAVGSAAVGSAAVGSAAVGSAADGSAAPIGSNAAGSPPTAGGTEPQPKAGTPKGRGGSGRPVPPKPRPPGPGSGSGSGSSSGSSSATPTPPPPPPPDPGPSLKPPPPPPKPADPCANPLLPCPQKATSSGKDPSSKSP